MSITTMRRKWHDDHYQHFLGLRDQARKLLGFMDSANAMPETEGRQQRSAANGN